MASAIELIAETGTDVQVPFGDFLLRAEFVRAGEDLLLVGRDGSRVLIDGYFAEAHAPALHTMDGAMLPGDLVERLAGPRAPGQYAAAGDLPGQSPVGLAEQVVGAVTAMHANGVRVALKSGDPVFQGDVIQTGGDGKIGIVFADKTAFALESDARIVLDELIYDPATRAGSGRFSLVQGVFVYISGEIEHHRPEAINIRTPVATIGIRGTTLGIEVHGAAQGGVTDVVVISGAALVTNNTGSVLLDQVGASTHVLSIDSPPGAPIIVSASDLQSIFGDAAGLVAQAIDDFLQTQPQGPGNQGPDLAPPPDSAPGNPDQHGDNGGNDVFPPGTIVVTLDVAPATPPGAVGGYYVDVLSIAVPGGVVDNTAFAGAAPPADTVTAPHAPASAPPPPPFALTFASPVNLGDTSFSPAVTGYSHLPEIVLSANVPGQIVVAGTVASSVGLSTISAAGLTYGVAVDVSAMTSPVTVIGGAGNDTITAGPAGSLLLGNGGDDLFVVTNADLTSHGITVDGGAGANMVQVVDSGILTDAAFAELRSIQILTFGSSVYSESVTLGAAAAAAGIQSVVANGFPTFSLDATGDTAALDISVGAPGGGVSVTGAELGLDTFSFGGSSPGALHVYGPVNAADSAFAKDSGLHDLVLVDTNTADTGFLALGGAAYGAGLGQVDARGFDGQLTVDATGAYGAFAVQFGNAGHGLLDVKSYGPAFTVTGGTQPSFDTLAVSLVGDGSFGSVFDSSFGGVSNVGTLRLVDGIQHGDTAALGVNAANAGFATVDGSHVVGNLTLDVSGDSVVHSILGGSGSNLFLLADAEVKTDTIAGNGTLNVLEITDAANLTVADFAHDSGMQALTLADSIGGDSQFVSLGDSSGSVPFSTVNAALTHGPVTLDASGDTNAVKLVGGYGGDTFVLTSAEVHSDTVVGVQNGNVLQIADAANLSDTAFAHDYNVVSGALTLQLADTVAGDTQAVSLGADAAAAHIGTIDASAAQGPVTIDITGDTAGAVIDGGNGNDHFVVTGAQVGVGIIGQGTGNTLTITDSVNALDLSFANKTAVQTLVLADTTATDAEQLILGTNSANAQIAVLDARGTAGSLFVDVSGRSGVTVLNGNNDTVTVVGGFGGDMLSGNVTSGAGITFEFHNPTTLGVVAGDTVAPPTAVGDLIQNFRSGTDAFNFVNFSPGTFATNATFVTIGQAYNGTNSGVASGAAFIFDGAGNLIYDPNVQTAGYTLIAHINSGTISHADVHVDGVPR
ncbi:MAG TPA: FecR domain-containing protein [Candidatus Cybelea sp.]|nr:FecR domain-containing protein [Candidatus Cybelea sp.]